MNHPRPPRGSVDNVAPSSEAGSFRRILRKCYRHASVGAYLLTSGKGARRTMNLNPAGLEFGQVPASQFSMWTRRFVFPGDWDRQLIRIENHSVYRSMSDHFLNGLAWEETLHYREAMTRLKVGSSFRGFTTPEQTKDLFQGWDRLYESIKTDGFRGTGELYRLGLIDDPRKCFGEITVNIARDGAIILNDGWHRFCMARILGIPSIPVRLLVRHRLCDQPLAIEICES